MHRSTYTAQTQYGSLQGRGVVSRIRMGLVVGAILLFALALFVCYTIALPTPSSQLTWHEAALLLCFFGFWVVTSAPKAFKETLAVRLMPLIILIILVLAGAFFSHGLQALVLLTQAAKVRP